jgi:hypothetical protein
MLLSQASYRGAGLAAPLATLTVVNPVVAAAVGITMFGETFRYGATGTALALGCGVVAAGGLILLTTERITSTRDEQADSTAVAPADVAPTGVAAEPGLVDELLASALTAQPVAAGHGEIREIPEIRQVRIPAPALPPQEEAYDGLGRSDDPSRSYTPSTSYDPFHGDPYVPVPHLDRHRTRVRT